MLVFFLYFWDNNWEYIDINRGFLIYKLFLKFADDLKNGANAGIYLNFHLAIIYQSKACINEKNSRYYTNKVFHIVLLIISYKTLL